MKGMEGGTSYTEIVFIFPPCGTILILFVKVTRKGRRKYNLI